MKRYCIFKVYDYKGGELSSSINLTFEKFIGELSELFEGIDIDSLQEKRDKKIKSLLEEENSINTIKLQIIKMLKSNQFYSNYAGGDGFCGKCYEVEDNKLKSVKIDDYIDDIAKYIDKNWDI